MSAKDPERAPEVTTRSPLTWSFWKYIWVEPKPGDHKIAVRTIDGKGRVQTYGPRDIFPDGATGQQRLEVIVI